MGDQIPVLFAPRERPPVVRILPAFKPGLVAVINQRHPREREHDRRVALDEAPRLRPLPAAKTEHFGHQARHVVGSGHVCEGVKVLPRVVLLQILEDLVRVAGGNFRRIEREQRLPERVVGHRVQLALREIRAQLSVAELVGGVLPDLAQNDRLRSRLGARFVRGRPQFLYELVRKLVSHVQPPAGNALPEPVAHHRVVVFDNEIKVTGREFVHVGKHLHAPPAVVLVVGLLRKTVPVPVLGTRVAVGAAAESALFVEVDTVAAGVAENAVQHDLNLLLRAHEQKQVESRVAAQKSVHVHVVLGVVAVVAGRPEYGVEVDHVGPERLDVGNFFVHARQVAALEIPALYLAAFPAHVHRLVVPGPVHERVGLPLAEGVVPLREPVGKYLVYDGVAEPLRNRKAFSGNRDSEKVPAVALAAHAPASLTGLGSAAVKQPKIPAALKHAEPESVPHNAGLLGREFH